MSAKRKTALLQQGKPHGDWLIRLIVIQGTVAPGWVQEWVQCTLFFCIARLFFPESNCIIDPAFGNRSRAQTKAMAQTFIGVEFRRDADRPIACSLFCMVRQLAIPSLVPTQA